MRCPFNSVTDKCKELQNEGISTQSLGIKALQIILKKNNIRIATIASFTTKPGDFSHSGLATPNMSEMVSPILRFCKLAVKPSHNLWHSVSKFRLQFNNTPTLRGVFTT